MDPKKHYKFNKCAITVLRVLFGWIVCLVTGYRCKHYKAKADTFLLLSNHTMDMDPIYATITLRKYLRFVASANIMKGFPGCLVKILAGPIPRVKGAPADDVVEAVKANLDAGISVAMYPEGNTTWDGESGFISKRTAELVKESKGSLITFRAIGGYLKMPRWSKVKRSGRTYGSVVAEYSREELDLLSVDDIYDIICKDLYVNAYDEQEKLMYDYKCKALAEGLEAALYVCPVCKSVGTMSSEKDIFSCSCGAQWRYTVKGYLEPVISESNEQSSASALNTNPDTGSLNTVLAWSRWQKKWLKENAESLKAKTIDPICSNGRITAYGDRIEADGKSYRYEDISKMSVFRATRLFFTHKGESIEVYVDPKEGRVGQEYFALWRICTDKEYI